MGTAVEVIWLVAGVMAGLLVVTLALTGRPGGGSAPSRRRLGRRLCTGYGPFTWRARHVKGPDTHFT